MGQYTSYYLYQKFEKRDGQDFIPVYPNTYSVDADGTMPRVVKNENDENCGYTPPAPDPIYRWVQITPTSDPSTYVCDECPIEPTYRWVQMTPTSDPSTYVCDECPIAPIYRWADSGTTCVNCDKYQRAIKQVSYDNGSTWENVSPAEYTATTLIEANSYDCGYRARTVEGDPYCDGVDKCYDVYSQVSHDSGVTWETTATTTTLIEANSYDCGYRTGETSGTPYCDYTDHNKYIDVYSQVSYDSGNTWTTTATTTTVYEYRSQECGYNPTYKDEYLTFEALENSSFAFSGRGSNSLSYSLDNGSTWTALASNVSSPTISTGEKILWKGACTPTTSGIGRFSSTGRFNVEGNIMSLLFGDNFLLEDDLTGYDKAFMYLFSGNTNVVNAENFVLPATTLSTQCYYSMFYGCYSLTTAPVLSATTLAQSCYYGMFSGCTSLTIAPDLPATTLADRCYMGMFSGCVNLTTLPTLPATTMVRYCYYGMFQNCGFSTLPSLSAVTTLADYCFSSMFEGNYHLITVPSNYLPFTTLAQGCYSNMFRFCSQLTTAPDLPATSLAEACYANMFQNCYVLNYVKCLATNKSATDCTTSWLYGVASSGTFVKASSTSWSRGDSGIPSGWTVQNA